MQRAEEATPKAGIDETLEALLASAGNLSAVARASLREDLRLQLEYPDCYVAYLDTWTGEGEGRRLVHQVVADAAALAELHARLAQLPADVRARATLEYVLDPNGPLDLAHPHVNP
jgi:hypothetical protein